MKLRIEKISEKTIEGYWRCLDSVARERKYIGFVEAPPLEKCTERVRENIEKKLPHFVALVNDEVIGWIAIKPYKLLGFSHVGELRMGILREHRRKEIGSKLLQSALEYSKRTGIEKIELYVHVSNTAAIAFYKKHGFFTEGRKRKTRKLDGVYDDVVIMSRFLNSI